MKDDFVSSGRAISDLKAHLVLTTKYRRKVFTGQMIERLQTGVWELCCKWDCKMIEVNGEADHIHLLFQYYPQLELPKFVGNSNCGGVTVSQLKEYVENQKTPN